MSVYYDDPRYSYEDYWQGRAYESKVDKTVLNQLLGLIENKEDKKIVEVGAGFGRLVEVYLEKFKKVILVEPSIKLLDLAKERLKNYPEVDYREGSLEKIPCKTGTVDTILVVRVLHHIENLDLVFLEINRVLKKKGFLILEYANKLHLLSRIRAFFKRDFSYAKDESVVDKRSFKNVIEGSIPFNNYHPKSVNRKLKKAGFEIKKEISASYFRRGYIKKMLPSPLLSSGERVLQAFLSGLWLGPSNFVLVQKIRNV